jgi:hypothetical protein
MSTCELRYRGQLLGFHDGEDVARAHVEAHHAGIEDKDSLIIEPRRPVELYCRGTLVDTFHTVEGAHAVQAKSESERAPESVWLIVDTRTEDVAQALSETYAPPAEEHPA